MRVFKNQGEFKLDRFRRSELIALAGFLGLCLAVELSGSLITIDNVRRWYLTLTPPPLTPPNQAFAIAWSILYLTIAVSAWMIWRQPGAGARNSRALTLWGWQLGLNALWTPVFFGLHMLAVALVVILALVAAIALTIARFWRLSRPAALLLVPYLAWVCFASYLNLGFWWLNH